MLDETIITETPPLSSCYGRLGQQVRISITGNRARRVLHGALSIRTGATALLMTDDWDQDTHQYFLTMVRSPWTGSHIALSEHRGPPHAADASLALTTPL